MHCCEEGFEGTKGSLKERGAHSQQESGELSLPPEEAGKRTSNSRKGFSLASSNVAPCETLLGGPRGAMPDSGPLLRPCDHIRELLQVTAFVETQP